MRKIIIIGLVLFPIFVSGQILRTEDDVVWYFDNATDLDLLEGIYHDRFTDAEYWHAVIYNKTSGAFDFYTINSNSRVLELFCGYDMHFKRATKYSYTYYAYVIIDGQKYESSAITFDPQHLYAHWVCKIPNNTVHVTINLENKVYPQ